MKTKTTRVCAGVYRVTDGTRTVTVDHIDFGDYSGWIAAAEWDRYRYTDALETKRHAVECAEHMLATWNDF